MVFARASASCWPTRRCDHCRMCWDDLWVKHDLFFWGWKSSQFGHEIRHCIRQMVRFAETSGFGANNSQATRKNLQITSRLEIRTELQQLDAGSCAEWPEVRGHDRSLAQGRLGSQTIWMDPYPYWTSQLQEMVSHHNSVLLLSPSLYHLIANKPAPSHVGNTIHPQLYWKSHDIFRTGIWREFPLLGLNVDGRKHCPRTWQLLTEDGPRTTSYFCRGSPTHCSLHLWIYRLLHVKMPDSKSRQIPYLAKVGQG